MSADPRSPLPGPALSEELIEAVLVQHRMDDESRTCTCGAWAWAPGPARPSELHRMHVAAVLARVVWTWEEVEPLVDALTLIGERRWPISTTAASFARAALARFRTPEPAHERIADGRGAGYRPEVSPTYDPGDHFEWDGKSGFVGTPESEGTNE